MQFQTPQFIDIEDKIFGPLTFKQFVYLAGGGGMCFVFYRFFPFYVAALFIVPIAALSLALAFYKINNKPFVFFLESSVKYFIHTKLYIWRKEKKKIEAAQKEEGSGDGFVYIPKLSDSKLKEIAWSLDVNNEALR